MPSLSFLAGGRWRSGQAPSDARSGRFSRRMFFMVVPPTRRAIASAPSPESRRAANRQSRSRIEPIACSWTQGPSMAMIAGSPAARSSVVRLSVSRRLHADSASAALSASPRAPGRCSPWSRQLHALVVVDPDDDPVRRSRRPRQPCRKCRPRSAPCRSSSGASIISRRFFSCCCWGGSA